MSGLLGGLFLVIWLATPDDVPVGVVSVWLGVTNLGVAIFNMFPGFPLDGGRVLRSVLLALMGSLDRATQWSGWVGVLFGRILIAAGILIAVLTGSWFNGLFLAFMGWFLSGAARRTMIQSVMTSRLRSTSVAAALQGDLEEVDGWDTLEDVVNQVKSGTGPLTALVAEDGEPVGVIGELELSTVAEGKRAYHVARQVMTPLARLISIESGESLMEALRTLDREGVGQLLVSEDGRFLGVLTRDQLGRVVNAR